jgi:hypothetical protein
VIQGLASDARRGLSAAEAQARLAAHGRNELAGAPPVRAWRKFLAQFGDTLVLLLLAAAGISVALWAYERDAAAPYDAIAIGAVVLLGLLVIWRPLRFDSLDPQSAAARGVPTTAVSLAFMLLLGLIVAVAVHIIGALLVMALLVTPAAAAMRVATGPIAVPVLAMVFGFVSAVGGILLAIMGTLPVSPYITTISFVIYLVCRAIGARRELVPRTRPSLRAAR